MKSIEAEQLTLGIVNGAISLITESGKFIRSTGLIIHNIDRSKGDLARIDLTIYIGNDLGLLFGEEYTTYKENSNA